MTTQAVAGPRVEIEPGWGQGRATFGGAVAALVVARMRGMLAEPIPLRTVSVLFVAPVAPGPATIEATVLRAGSSATLVRAELVQDGQVAASAQAAFGRDRESVVVVDAEARAPFPAAPDAEGVPRIPFIEGLTPDFIAKVDLRPTSGAMPYSGASDPDMGGWMRLDETVINYQAEHLIAAIDAWPVAITPMLPSPAPASTLSWTVDLIEPPATTAGTDHWRYQARTDEAGDGYGHCRSLIWSADGRLVATSQQTLTVFG